MQKKAEALDVIERTPFYSNKMMVESLTLIKDVVLATVTIKERVGKKYIERQVPKFKTDKDVIDKILRSLDYYSNPNNEEMKDKITPTAAISGTVQFRDYQTKIIHQGEYPCIAGHLLTELSKFHTRVIEEF